jgi:hypothetical protein
VAAHDVAIGLQHVPSTQVYPSSPAHVVPQPPQLSGSLA